MSAYRSARERHTHARAEALYARLLQDGEIRLGHDFYAAREAYGQTAAAVSAQLELLVEQGRADFEPRGREVYLVLKEAGA